MIINRIWDFVQTAVSRFTVGTEWAPAALSESGGRSEGAEGRASPSRSAVLGISLAPVHARPLQRLRGRPPHISASWGLTGSVRAAVLGKFAWRGLCLLSLCGTPAHAQADATGTGAAPDKSAYTLFDPTPVDQMRSFCTDRPTKSNFPCTVDAGHFQYESDVINWSYAHTGGATTNTYLFTNPTLKLGLTNTIDAELNIVPAERIFTKSSLGRSSIGGAGDLLLRTKVNLVGPEGGDFQLTALPYLKLPTAKPGIGNKAVEGGLIAPVLFGLPSDFALLFDPEIDILRNALNSGRHVNFASLVNLGHTLLSESVTGYVELFGSVNDDPSGMVKQASLDLAVEWIVSDKAPGLQLDLGANIGLTSATPRVQAYAGISQRF
jgi:hypothetical protein